MNSIGQGKSYLFEIPPGKPSPNGERVFQNGRGDHGNCFLYAAKIASCWPRCLDPDQQLVRKNLTTHRKRIEQYVEHEWHKRTTVLNIISAVARYLNITLNDSQETKKWISNQYPKIAEIIENEKNIRPGTAEIAQSFLTDFETSRHTSLEEFYYESSAIERTLNHFKFLKSEIPNLTEELNKRTNYYQTLEIFPTDTFLNLSPHQRYHIIHEVFIEHVAKIFRLTPCSWRPEKGIETLIEALQSTGPMVASGFLGSSFSMNEPKFVKSEKCYDVYAIASDPAITKKKRYGHAVILVGAVSGPQKLVYFIDPSDDSSPSKNRRLYSIPFERFCENIRNKLGMKDQNDSHFYLWTKSRSIDSPAQK